MKTSFYQLCFCRIAYFGWRIFLFFKASYGINFRIQVDSHIWTQIGCHCSWKCVKPIDEELKVLLT